MINNGEKIPDYLDVSSDEEKIIYNNNKEKEDLRYYRNKDNSKEKYYKKMKYYKEENNSSESYDSRNYYNRKEKYPDDYNYHEKYIHRNYRRSNSRSNRSRSERSIIHSKKYHNYRRERSRSRHYDSRNRTPSRNNSRQHEPSRKMNKYESSYSRDKYDSKHRSRSKSKSRTKTYHEKKEEKKKLSKWTDGEKKEDFKSIKIEKYDKKKLNKNENTQKEILKLKEDLRGEHQEEVIEKEKPNFEPSGILQKDLENEYNTLMNNDICIKYKPPSDSIIPKDMWYLFKFLRENKETSETYKLIGKEFFLIGKDIRICDVHIKQKNVSRQHAIIQFRKITKDDGKNYIVPYLIDLNSTNGSFLNGDKIDNNKYYELRDKDSLNFGDKKIDFVLMKME